MSQFYETCRLAALTSLQPHTFTTRGLDNRIQHEAWQDWFRPIFDVTAIEAGTLGFIADNHVTRFGDVTVSRVSAPAVRFARTRQQVKRDPTDHWVLSCCRRGITTFSSRGSRIEVPAGVPFLWSLAAEFESTRTEVERVAFYLPRDTFRTVASALDFHCGAIVPSAMGRILGDYMLSLDEWLPSVSALEAPRLSASVHAMVAASVAPSADRLALAGAQLDLGRLERVRRTVRKHLRSPKLTPASLSRAVGISRSNLYRLFEGSGGVSRYIQTQRLLEAHAALCNPSTEDSIAAIAETFCFVDASSFSRAFRREFGHTPSDVRAAAMAGLMLVGTPQSEGMGETGDRRQSLRLF